MNLMGDGGAARRAINITKERQNTVVELTRSGAVLLAALILPLAGPAEVVAQHPAGENHSDNVNLVAHLPLGAPSSVSDIVIEQDTARPYAYVSRMRYRGQGAMGFDLIGLEDPSEPEVLYEWRIENASLHAGNGGMDGDFFRLDGRTYYVQAVQFARGGPDHDLGAVVFDVTSLPDTSGIEEVGRIRTPEIPGGFHNVFAYKHSSGRALLFTTLESAVSDDQGANVYDMRQFLDGAEDDGLVGTVPLPRPRGAPRGYHDMYVACHPASGEDRFYGGGPEVTYQGGNFIYDVSDPSSPELLAVQRAQPGQQAGGHTFVPGPRGRYVLSEMNSLAHAPVRIYDMQPALDGEVEQVQQPIAAWTADWRKSAHNFEVRWPYVFISNYTQGLQILDVRHPRRPEHVGFWDTYDYETPYSGGSTARGLFGVDVRDADGLIVGSDMHSGFWAWRLRGFEGWDGADWGVPDISSAQDWQSGTVDACQ